MFSFGQISFLFVKITASVTTIAGSWLPPFARFVWNNSKFCSKPRRWQGTRGNLCEQPSLRSWTPGARKYHSAYWSNQQPCQTWILVVRSTEGWTHNPTSCSSKLANVVRRISCTDRWWRLKSTYQRLGFNHWSCTDSSGMQLRTVLHWHGVTFGRQTLYNAVQLFRPMRQTLTSSNILRVKVHQLISSLAQLQAHCGPSECFPHRLHSQLESGIRCSSSSRQHLWHLSCFHCLDLEPLFLPLFENVLVPMQCCMQWCSTAADFISDNELITHIHTYVLLTHTQTNTHTTFDAIFFCIMWLWWSVLVIPNCLPINCKY